MPLGETPFRALVIGAGIALALLLLRVRFYGDFALPAKPARPAALAADPKSVAKSIKHSTAAYQNFLEQDATRFGIARVSAQTMASVFPYAIDEQQRVLSVGDKVEVLGLALTLSEETIKGARRSHMVLTIANQGFKPIAYRIQTRPSTGARSCSKMSQLPHNAVAVAAGGTERRTECLFRKGSTLEINAVETVALPELGFHYLSAVSPEILGLEDRISRLHKRASDAMPCQLLQSASMRKAVSSGEITWRDQVDFYARHRCSSYSLPSTYKAFQRDGEQILPFSGADL